MHKEAGHVNVKDKKCQHVEGCCRRPSYGSVDDRYRGQIVFKNCLDFYGRSPESGDLWYASTRLKKMN